MLLSVPKFSISAELDLVEEFQHLGITEVFSDPTDQSRTELKVSKAVHKVALNMAEEGTEAAPVGTRSEDDHLPPPYWFDPHFIFVFQSKKLPIPTLLGRIINPNEGMTSRD
ncbi:alpha-1-antitrypsin-like [Hyla sarda]|uniref:alpha-1-antitrypsin-like n=1 Tax=Hyla sarda TaxID=327740 RepID=UPI0024C428D9|nr:alpha-1-antitrypsin-like [Hyla sarda]